MNENSSALLMGQIAQKQQMKQEILHSSEASSFPHQESEKLLALSKVVRELGQEMDVSSLLRKERKAVESYLEELRAGYRGLPNSIRDSAAGRQLKNSVIMTTAAVHRLEAGIDAPTDCLPLILEEAAFLLEGADGRA